MGPSTYKGSLKFDLFGLGSSSSSYDGDLLSFSLLELVDVLEDDVPDDLEDEDDDDESLEEPLPLDPVDDALVDLDLDEALLPLSSSSSLFVVRELLLELSLHLVDNGVFDLTLKLFLGLNKISTGVIERDLERDGLLLSYIAFIFLLILF